MIDFAVGVCAAAIEVALLAGRNRSISWMDVDYGVHVVVVSDAWSRCLMRFGVWGVIPEGVDGVPFIEGVACLEVLLGTGICSVSGVHCNIK